MLSVVIPTLNSEEALARTLSVLVPAAADGIVREVVVVDGGSTDSTVLVAEGTGCQLVASAGPVGERMRAGAEVATRGDWLMFLMPGVLFDGDWFADFRTLMERIDRAGKGLHAVCFTYDTDDFGAAAKLSASVARFKRRLTGIPRAEQGLIVPSALYRQAGGIGNGQPDLASLCRRIGRRRIVDLRVTASRVIHDDQSH
ncbi:glycosyltransferase [Oryzibacter oryziterrae]|uniref:glycosyltransferase n=1 Tax=Oryzibacter oryziterrae TaxID=2766474 RepID=UPI001F3885A0|nr:glycosyltransferase [Oryzibacter oryziterrae]